MSHVFSEWPHSWSGYFLVYDRLSNSGTVTWGWMNDNKKKLTINETIGDPTVIESKNTNGVCADLCAALPAASVYTFTNHSDPFIQAHDTNTHWIDCASNEWTNFIKWVWIKCKTLICYGGLSICAKGEKLLCCLQHQLYFSKRLLRWALCKSIIYSIYVAVDNLSRMPSP